MNIKLIIFLVCMAVMQPSTAVAVSSSSMSAVVKPASRTSEADKKQTIPVITNEAEYAAWVRQRDGSSQASAKSSNKSNSTSSRSSKTTEK